MNKALAIFLSLIMITMGFSGCFGDDDVVPPGDDTTDDTPELDDWSVHFAAGVDDLPECNAATNGRLYYVEADNNFHVCKAAGWEIIPIMGADGSDGSDGPPDTGSHLDPRPCPECRRTWRSPGDRLRIPYRRCP